MLRLCALALSATAVLCAPSLALSAISDGLVAYFPFNGDAQDASGNGNHGAVNGNVTYVDGPVGKAAKFNGVSSQGGGQNPDHIVVRNSASLKMTNAMTVSYWVKFNSTKSQTWADCSGRIVNETNGHVLAKSGDRTGFYFGEGDFSSGFGIVPYSGGQGLGSGTTQLPSALSQYRHIAYTVNGNSIKLYVNGQLHTQGTGVVDYTSANSQNMYIGTMHSQGYACLNYWGQLDGSLDELRIYNRALSASEVQELKNYSTTGESSTPPTSTTATATPCPDQIFPWPNKSIDGKLCLPVVNIPTGNNSYASFYLTWMTNTPSAANPTYFITDVRPYASEISGNSLFDPVFYKPETNTVDVYFPDNGWSIEKYEVLLQTPLGLRKIANTSTPVNPTPQSCVADAVTLTWQGSTGATCSAPSINSGSGQVNVIGSTNGNTGGATFTCTDGTWSSPSSATCSAPAPAPTPQSCASTTLIWSGTSGQSCSASSSTTSSGQSLTLANTQSNGNTGSATFTCTNGSWSNPSSGTCSSSATVVPACDPNSKSCQ